MRKIIPSLAIAISALAFSAAPILAAEFIAPGKDEGNVTISTTETHRNLYTAGGNVLINGATQGDLFVAGGNVTVEGAVEQDVVAAGGTVYINGAVGGDVRVAGGNVTINGKISGDLLVFGGTVNVSDKSTVGGDVVACGGEVDIAAPIAGKLQANGGKVNINSTVAGAVTVNSGEELIFGSKAVVNNVTHRGPKEAVVQDGATVGAMDYQRREGHNRGAGKAMAAIFTIGFVIKLIAAVIFALVMLYLFPATSRKVLDQVGNRPGLNFLVGLIGLIVVPIVSILIMVIVFGLYLGILALIAYAMLLLLAGFAASVYTGAWVSQKLTKKEAMIYDWQAVVIGMVIFAILKFIPIIGWLVVCVLMLIAFGSMLRSIHDYQKRDQVS